jgi:hypothetical protein
MRNFSSPHISIIHTIGSLYFASKKRNERASVITFTVLARLRERGWAERGLNAYTAYFDSEVNDR